ncbi:hypothetical protein [Thalassospira sp.]|jgi:hypothetical protein|uniref:hypothetical protein n=1 Tax=Thalassospira sp. TaxID=1912094 RepID=UPI0025E77485|nr:hypothetical protein [Thalassospira sp.]|tara:strand:+ start:8483 stop:10327 length:1845 start_codon:yes stop_codon:yes gene_type:complete
MPLTKLNFQPGLDTENTETGAEGRWIDGDKIRFRKGLPQKLGGWNKFSLDYYVGVGRALEQWFSLTGARYEALGTDRKVYVYASGDSQDITPIRLTANVVNAFTTTNTSANITISHSSHGAGVGDFVTLSSSSSSVGGIPAATLDAEYEILSITNADAYIISSNATATSTAGPTGNCTAIYQLNIGPDEQTFGYGWGAGTWSTSTWGTPRSTSNVTLDMRMWSINNWGEDLIITQKDGATYEWDTSGGMSGNRATPIANAPTNSTLSLVSTETRHVICMGTETSIGNTSTQDKMFIRWSDQEEYNQWTPNVTNSAGSQRIAGGSEIRCARPAKGTILVWTDTTMQSMSFIGPPFIFGFRQLGNDCGAVGLNSAIVIDDIAYWMSDGQFFRYAGAVQEIPCPVLNHVFDDINKVQYPQVYAAQNSNFSEVIWYYCSSSSSQCDKYVIYNYLENSWSFGTMNRSTYQDNGVELNPLATEYTANSTANTYIQINGLTQGRSLIYRMEDGVDADGSALSAYIQSGDGDLADGEEFMFINKIIPDFQNQTGNTLITLTTRDYPYGNTTVGETVAVSNTTGFINTRIRGRQSNIKIENTAIGDNWRFGTLRVNLRADGKR